jgi:hypothetical protein
MVCFTGSVALLTVIYCVISSRASACGCPRPFQSCHQKLLWGCLNGGKHRKAGPSILVKSFTRPESHGLPSLGASKKCWLASAVDTKRNCLHLGSQPSWHFLLCPLIHSSLDRSLCDNASSGFWASTVTLITNVTSYHWNGIKTLLSCKTLLLVNDYSAY